MFPNPGYAIHLDEKAYLHTCLDNIGSNSDHSHSHGYALSSIIGLVKLGILEERLVKNAQCFILSSLGKEVYKAAVANGDSKD